jgi:parvulin-like peptidyl-prolyl isomerase
LITFAKRLKYLFIFVWLLGPTACTQNLPATAAPPAIPQTEVIEAGPEATSLATQSEEGAVISSEVVSENGLALAAKVNDQPIFLETYQKQVHQFEQTLQAQGLDLASEEGQTTLGQIQRQVLDALIDQAIIEQEAAQLGISVSEETIETKAQESVTQGQGQEQFEAWLVANNLTYEEFKDTIRFQTIANQMFEQITSNVSESAEQIELRQILVADEATARTIIEQLKTGVDFATLAQEYSLDESNRDAKRGGSLGWFPRQAGLVPPNVEEIAFSLQQNEVSGPIKTPLGFHIIQLQNRETDRPLKIEMLQALKEQLFTAWLMERRAASTIEKFVTP